MNWLAEIAQTPDPMISGNWLTAIVGTILTGLAGFIGHRAGKSQSFKIEGQPLAVKMEDHFVTRREFENLEARMANDLREMKSLFRETQILIRERDEKLTDTIKETAQNAYEGRGKLWKKVNETAEIHGARIKSLEDRTPVKTTR